MVTTILIYYNDH